MSQALASAQKALLEGDYENAIDAYQELLAATPDDAKLYLELSSCMMKLGKADEALVVAKQATMFATPDVRMHCDLQMANIYLLQERFDLAGNLFQTIIHANPREVEAHLGLASLYLKTGYPTKACALLAHIKERAGSEIRWVMNMSNALFESRQVDAAIELLLQHTPTPATLSNALMFSNYTDKKDMHRARILPLLAAFYPKTVQNIAPSLKLKKLSVAKKLKVGFVSADFCWHPVGYFLYSFLPHLAALDVEIYLYANMPSEDSLTHKIRECATRFSNIYGLKTDVATKLIRDDALDILVDLSGHTAGHRLDVFSMRPAPVQASYLGYSESTHVPGMDYVITDETHVHADEHKNFSEKICCLPGSRFCFAPPMNAPAIAPAPHEINHYVTFGSFANPSKISDACVVAWGEILKALPNARLKLRHRSWEDHALRAPPLAQWQTMGIASGRIEFYGHCKYDAYLAAYGELDFVIDTEPFTGGTTTCEALWMGVPVITQGGKSPAARQGVSILQAIGEAFWIIADTQDAIQKIQDVTRSPEHLRTFKSEVRSNIMQSNLGNGAAFAQSFYRALTDTLARHYS